MGIARSSYYYNLGVNHAAKEERDEQLKLQIEDILTGYPFYGYRRVLQSLVRQGLKVNHKRVRRIMAKYGLGPKIPRRFVVTTQSNPTLMRYPNLIKNVQAVTNLNEVWVADITYIRLAQGFAYLAVILDLCSRKVVGWALSKKIDSNLSVAALNMAIETRNPGPDCIHHSDHGTQYASNTYIESLEKSQFRISMSAKGNPYENAFAETFMKTLKYEEVYLSKYKTFEDALVNVTRFIEEVYNQKRLHSSIGYLSPNEYEWMLSLREQVNQTVVSRSDRF